MGNLNPRDLQRMRASRGYKTQALVKSLAGVRKIGFFTPVNTANPYQSLLYATQEVDFLPIMNLARAERLSRLKLFDFLHLHWDESIFWGEGGHDYARSLHASIGQFDRLRARGVKTIWTVHNYGPHEAYGPEHLAAFQTFRKHLCDTVDFIHVHSHHAKDYLIEAFGTDGTRISVVGHPGYTGWYAPQARHRVPGDRKRFLMFGAMRKYKSVGAIVEAFRRIGTKPLIEELHFAGSGTEEELGLQNIGVPVKLSLRQIPDAMVPEVFQDADFSVLALQKSLTSGSAVLSMSFGVPPIMPDLPGIAEGLPPELARSSTITPIRMG